MRTWSPTPVTLALTLALGVSACSTSDDPEVGVWAAPIVGGVATTGYQAVPLLYSEFADGTAALCSGTLISPRVVLTAAHCVEFTETPTVYVAYFGADVTIDPDPNRLDSIPVAEFTFHPEWDIDDLAGGHDVGLVLLASPGPVPPMRYNRTPIDARIGEQVHLVGWGKTTGEGEDYGKKREAMTNLQDVDPLLMQYGSASANTCQGDSGGPNFMTEGGVEVVAGITSFGNIGCDQYGVGTRVDTFAADFIDPYISAKDPAGACVADGACSASCGTADPDCPTEGPDGSGGDDDGSGGDEGGGGDGTGAAGTPPVTGGCSAGGRTGSPGFFLLLGLGALLAIRRRRAA